MKNRIIPIILLICVISFGVLLIHSTIPKKDKIESFEDMMTFLQQDLPYICNEDTYLDSEEGLLGNGTTNYFNYHNKAVETISYIVSTKDVDHEVLEVMENLMTTFYLNKKFPREAYAIFQEGWVSSMDAPNIALLSYLVFLETGDERYRTFVTDISNYMLTDTTEGGFILKESDGNEWALEYADKNTTEENAYYVVNGTLNGLTGMKIIADLTDNQDMQLFIDKNIENLKKKESQFLYPEKDWCYYMLNPLTINRTEKIAIELRSCDSLYRMTGEKIFKKFAQDRREMLAGTMKLACFQDETGKWSYVFMRGNAPHPYYIDVFENKIDFLDKDGTVIARHSYENGRKYENSIYKRELPEGAVSAKIYAYTTNSNLLFCEQKLEKIDKLEETNVPYVLEMYEGTDVTEVSEDGRIYIEKDHSTLSCGQVFLTLEKPMSTGTSQYQGIEIDADIKDDTSVELYITDEKGCVKYRYIGPLVSGKNLLFVNVLGFRDVEAPMPFGDIVKIEIKIISSSWENSTEGNFKINHILQFDNVGQYYHYFLDSPYKINFVEY